ncbi:hypothetical protein Celaphus_00009315, partial [Cervus elaphus hippelaphus]
SSDCKGQRRPEAAAAVGVFDLQGDDGKRTDLNITCRYAGVFHVEKNGRYSISKTEAADLCKAFNSTLPTMAQMEVARSIGFETCRYGFIDGHVVIPRIHPNSICAANNTGVYILTVLMSFFLFHFIAPPGEDCTSVTDLPNAFEGPITITIVNRDGTRYTKKGEYRTNPEDINPSVVSPSSPPDDEMSSGSPSERSTSGDYSIFHTHLPTMYPPPDQDSPWVSSKPENTSDTSKENDHAAAQEQCNWMWSWFGNSQPKTQDQTTAVTAQLLTQVTTTGTDSSIISAGWEPTEENEDERDRHPSYSGSGIDDDEDFISSTISTTPWVFTHPQQNQNWIQRNPDHLNPEASLQTTTRMTDVDRSSTSAYGESWTQEPHSSLSHQGYHDEEETPHSTSTTQAPTPSTTEETATQKEQWFENGRPGEHPQMPKEDSHSTAGTTVTTASTHVSHPHQRVTTQSQEDSSWTYFFDPVSHPMGRDTDTSPSTTHQPSADPNTSSVGHLDRTGPLSMTTQQSDTHNLSPSHGGLEEDKDHSTTATPTSISKDWKAHVASAIEKRSIRHGCFYNVFGGGASVGCCHAVTPDQKVWLVTVLCLFCFVDLLEAIVY